MRKLVSIIIPIYKEELNELEKISLNQLNKILHKYNKIFIAPERLKINCNYYNYEVIKFPNEYFDSIDSYNKLMLNRNFYKLFSDSEFILIYQLDAFVFNDFLEYFCSLKYDYIGAAWTFVTKARECKSYVGNGGLSLRRVASFIELLDNNKTKANSWTKNEDVFFSKIGYDNEEFKVASSFIADKFSLEHRYYKYNIARIKKEVFACHAWNKFDFNTIENIMSEYKYEMNFKHKEFGKLKKYRKNKILEYLVKRYNEVLFRGYANAFFSNYKDKDISIYGYGEEGKLWHNIFEKYNIKIKYIYDNSNLKQKCIYNKIDITKFCNNGRFIIITSIMHEEVITERLLNLGLIENVNFIKISTLFKYLLKRGIDEKTIFISRYIKK